jgi:hypothetical protein
MTEQGRASFLPRPTIADGTLEHQSRCEGRHLMGYFMMPQALGDELTPKSFDNKRLT